MTFSWRLDGQEFGMGPEAERTFEQEGKFDVALIVTDARGRREETRQAIIIAEQPLQVAFSAPQQVLSGQDVQFANETQPAERVSKWAWDFGDGVTSQDWNPLHRFANEGEASRVFNVVLRATSRSGRTYTSAPQSITVLPAQKPVPPPKAAFRILGGPFRAGRMVAFQDESTGLIESFAWDFNGEGTDDRKNPEFRFDTAGIKTIRLVVRGPGGTATASQQITVEPREVSAYLVWLNTNGQSIALPSRLDYGIANPVHVRNQELIVTVNDTFEVIVPQEMQRGWAVVLSLDEGLTQVFELEQLVAEGFRTVPTPARLLESARFHLKLRPDAPEGDHAGVLTVRSDGAGLLLNDKPDPITIALHVNISPGEAPSLAGLFVLLVAGYVACWLLAWVLATAIRQGTIVARCRQAWAWAFVVHLVVVVGLTVFWFQRFGFFKSFYVFPPFYIALGVIDLIATGKLFAGSRS